MKKKQFRPLSKNLNVEMVMQEHDEKSKPFNAISKSCKICALAAGVLSCASIAIFIGVKAKTNMRDHIVDEAISSYTENVMLENVYNQNMTPKEYVAEYNKITNDHTYFLNEKADAKTKSEVVAINKSAKNMLLVNYGILFSAFSLAAYSLGAGALSNKRLSELDKKAAKDIKDEIDFFFIKKAEEQKYSKKKRISKQSDRICANGVDDQNQNNPNLVEGNSK